MNRKEIYKLGLTAAQAGVASEEQLMRLIRLGTLAPTRAALACGFIDEGHVDQAKYALHGILS